MSGYQSWFPPPSFIRCFLWPQVVSSHQNSATRILLVPRRVTLQVSRTFSMSFFHGQYPHCKPQLPQSSWTVSSSPTAGNVAPSGSPFLLCALDLAHNPAGVIVELVYFPFLSLLSFIYFPVSFFFRIKVIFLKAYFYMVVTFAI